MLCEYLEKTGQYPLLLREPGSTFVSEGIRRFILDPANSSITPECEIILYVAARAQLVRERIRPELLQGRLVICDRFIDSTMAYQGFGRELDKDMVSTLNNIAIGDCVPDCTIFLDLEPELAFKRKGGRDLKDRLELENMDFHNRVYKGYKYSLSLNPDRIISVVPDGSVEDTHNKIISALKGRGMIY